jgi:hypothetical protein
MIAAPPSNQRVKKEGCGWVTRPTIKQNKKYFLVIAPKWLPDQRLASL